jgi:hypothetical protein
MFESYTVSRDGTQSPGEAATSNVFLGMSASTCNTITQSRGGGMPSAQWGHPGALEGHPGVLGGHPGLGAFQLGPQEDHVMTVQTIGELQVPSADNVDALSSPLGSIPSLNREGGPSYGHPGHLGSVPGNLGSVPGHLGSVPGRLGSVPGHLGSISEPPGYVTTSHLGSVPGHLGSAPPSHLGSVPGQLGSVPSHLTSVPGPFGSVPRFTGAETSSIPALGSLPLGSVPGRGGGMSAGPLGDAPQGILTRAGPTFGHLGSVPGHLGSVPGRLGSVPGELVTVKLTGLLNETKQILIGLLIVEIRALAKL